MLFVERRRGTPRGNRLEWRIAIISLGLLWNRDYCNAAAGGASKRAPRSDAHDQFVAANLRLVVSIAPIAYQAIGVPVFEISSMTEHRADLRGSKVRLGAKGFKFLRHKATWCIRQAAFRGFVATLLARFVSEKKKKKKKKHSCRAGSRVPTHTRHELEDNWGVPRR